MRQSDELSINHATTSLHKDIGKVSSNSEQIVWLNDRKAKGGRGGGREKEKASYFKYFNGRLPKKSYEIIMIIMERCNKEAHFSKTQKSVFVFTHVKNSLDFFFPRKYSHVSAI